MGEETMRLAITMLGGGLIGFSGMRLFAGDDGSTWYMAHGALLALGMFIVALAWSST